METTPVATVEKRVLIDLDRCIECGSCAAACYYSHTNMPSVGFARAGWALLPLICRQCKAAPCVEACPVEAMVRDDVGVVRRKLFRCIGCGSCVRACPFGVLPNELAGVPTPTKDNTRLSGHQVAKCDLCADRIESDPQAIPRCVAACSSGALSFVDEREPTEETPELLGGRTTGADPFKRR